MTASTKGLTLQEASRKKKDSTRSKFFWEGVGNKNKFHMIRWDALDKPKEFGGLGFIDTRAMNTALLCKWIYGLKNGEEGLGMTILRKKYLQGKGFSQSKCKGRLNFGKDCMQ